MPEMQERGAVWGDGMSKRSRAQSKKRQKTEGRERQKQRNERKQKSRAEHGIKR